MKAASGRVNRDLEVLRGLAGADEHGLGVVQIAELLDRDKSQISRALRALEEAGLVERDRESRRYHLGLELYALAARSAQTRLMRAAPLVMRPLAVELDETIHLCSLHGREVLTLRSIAPPTHAFRASGWEGRAAAAFATSAGRVLLGDHRPEEIHELFAGIDVRTPGPNGRVSNVDELVAVVAEARSSGYATVNEEFEAGLVGASAPVRNMRGDIVAALNVSADAGHLHELDAAGRACAVAGVRLSRLLGAPGRHPRAATALA